MKRSRPVLPLIGLAMLICVVAMASAPKASAVATKAKLMFRQRPLNLGLVHPGFTSTATAEVLNVSGLVPATIASVSINPKSPFSIASDGCTGVTLPAGTGNCSVVVQFAPTKKGKFSQPLKVAVNGEKTVFKVTVSGTGSLTAPTPSPTPTATTPATTPTPTPAPASPTPTPAVAPTTAGDVFLLGGYASSPVIYDPVAATAYNSGSSFAGGAGNDLLPENYQSVALPNGQILIAGGDDGTNAYNNAYIYNPATQTVSPTASMNQARTQFTLTLLNNGQVLAVGGSTGWVNLSNLPSSGSATTLASAEIYDPPSQTWTEVAPLSVARLAHAATLMPDGTVLITGGLTGDPSAGGYSLAQDYEFFTPPASGESGGSWSADPDPASPTSVQRFNHAAVLLDDGSVLLVGGQGTTSTPISIPNPVRYVTSTNFWQTAGAENTPRYADAVTRLADGEVLVAGGIDSDGNSLNTAETLNPNSYNWTPVAGTLPNAASGQAATLMPDGRVIIAGGTSSTVAMFDYSTGQFSAGGTLPSSGFTGTGSTAIVAQSAYDVLPVGAGPGIATSTAAAQSVSPNVAYTSVKVCVPGTSQCRVVDGVLVDTGSSGLRLFASKLQFPESSVAGFTPLATASGGQLGECFSFVASVAWGAVADADIYMGGEVAKSAPFQIINDSDAPGTFPSIPSSCNQSGALAPISSPSAAAAGFNGILGIGPIPNDLAANEYYSCNSGTCSALPSGTTPPQVIPNPAIDIQNAVYDETSTDYNGIGLAMNSVPGAGQAADYGNLTFGIGTESNNSPAAGVQVYGGGINNTYAGSILTKFGTLSEGYIDSGTNGFAFNDSSLQQCSSGIPPNGPWYCPASSVALSATNEGSTGTPVSPIVNFTIGNAENLIQNGFYAQPELGGPFGTPALFDWGLPFFYGRTVYVGISSALINSASYKGPFFAY